MCRAAPQLHVPLCNPHHSPTRWTCSHWAREGTAEAQTGSAAPGVEQRPDAQLWLAWLPRPQVTGSAVPSCTVEGHSSLSFSKCLLGASRAGPGLDAENTAVNKVHTAGPTALGALLWMGAHG